MNSIILLIGFVDSLSFFNEIKNNILSKKL